MARNLFEDKKGANPNELFEEYVKESDNIGKKKNESELQKMIRGFLKSELKTSINNFVRDNKVKDKKLDEKIKAFFDIFHSKFSKLIGSIFKMNKAQFLELARENIRNSAEAKTLWTECSTKYEYFKSHGVLNSELLKAFIQLFLSSELIRKEMHFFMMYRFDLIQDFNVSVINNKPQQIFDQLPPTESVEYSVSNVFNFKEKELLSDMTFEQKNGSVNSDLNNAISNINMTGDQELSAMSKQTAPFLSSK